MKFFIFLLLSLSLSGACNKVFADDIDPVLLFSISKNKVARVGAVNNTDKSLTLRIEDSNSESLFSINIKPNEEYFEFHNFASLPVGKYSIKLYRGPFKVQRDFYVSESDIILVALSGHVLYEDEGIFQVLSGIGEVSDINFVSIDNEKLKSSFFNPSYLLFSNLIGVNYVSG